MCRDPPYWDEKMFLQETGRGTHMGPEPCFVLLFVLEKKAWISLTVFF